MMPKNSHFMGNVKNLMRKFKLLAVVPLLAIVAITIAVATISYNLRNKSLSPLSPDSDPNAGSAECTLNLSLPTPGPSATPIVCESTKVDIVLALDRSGSMTWRDVNNISRLQGEITASLAFIDAIKSQSEEVRNNIRVGVVVWAGNNNKVSTLPLTNNFDSVRNYIESTVKYDNSDYYTCIDCAVNRSADLFTNASNKRFVILMSDGIGNRVIESCSANGNCTFPTPPPCTNDANLAVHCAAADTKAIESATARKATGITYHTVGYGRNTQPVRILEDNLRAISGNASSGSSTSFYHYAGDNTLDWSSIFVGILPTICNVTVPTPTPTVRPTATPTPVPTRTPTPRPTRTPTPTPAPQCSKEWCMSTYDLVPREQ